VKKKHEWRITFYLKRKERKKDKKKLHGQGKRRINPKGPYWGKIRAGKSKPGA